jgi:hypothetical protein
MMVNFTLRTLHFVRYAYLPFFFSVCFLTSALCIAQGDQDYTSPEGDERIQTACYPGVFNRFDLVQSAVADN